MNGGTLVNSQTINLTNMANSYKNTKSSHYGNVSSYDQSNSMKFGNVNRDFTQKSIFTELSEDGIMN